MIVSDSNFTPPTAQQVEDYLHQHPPVLPSPWSSWGPIAALAGVAVVGLVMGGVVGLLLPWLAIIGLLVFLSLRVRTARSLETQASRMHEMAVLRDYPQALRRAWRLLPAAASHPPLHARTIALMAQCLDHVQSYDAAIVGYDYLLSHLPSEHPGAVLLRIQRAIAALGAHRLTDADDTLRRLRGLIRPHLKTPLGAAYRLAQLIQQVRTNHFTDAVDEAEGLVDDLRPLSVEAGYGHALMALCHYRDTRADDPASSREQARRWWGQATLLLPESALLNRFPELSPLAQSPESGGSVAPESPIPNP